MLYGFGNRNKRTNKSQIKVTSNVNDANSDSLFFSKDKDEEDIKDLEVEIENNEIKENEKISNISEIQSHSYINNFTNFKPTKLSNQMLSFDNYEDEELHILVNNKKEIDSIISPFLKRKRNSNSNTQETHLRKQNLIVEKKINNLDENNPDRNVIHDMDQYDSVDHNETNNKNKNINDYQDYQEMKVEEEEEERDVPSNNKENKYKNKIEEIKKLREKKRTLDHKEETYDQDYVEMKQTKSQDLIKDVYTIISEHDLFDVNELEDQSDDSEKEILQWEMGKLKNGLSAHWANNQSRKSESKSTVIRDMNDIFKKFNLKVELDEIIHKVKEDINTDEQHQESLNFRLENYEEEIEENNHKKLITIQKIDDYILQYRNFKKCYAHMVKDIKSKFIFNSIYFRKRRN